MGLESTTFCMARSAVEPPGSARSRRGRMIHEVAWQRATTRSDSNRRRDLTENLTTYDLLRSIQTVSGRTLRRPLERGSPRRASRVAALSRRRRGA